MDVLRTIKIYHIYIGQKIRLLDWLLVLFGATRRLFLIEATCAPEKPIRHKGRTFPQGQLEHTVLAQFSWVDRQTWSKSCRQLLGHCFVPLQVLWTDRAPTHKIFSSYTLWMVPLYHVLFSFPFLSQLLMPHLNTFVQILWRVLLLKHLSQELVC